MVSIIIPCRNGSAYLAEAIAGIQAQNVPVEIVLVDDGSTDDSGRIAAELGCRVIRKEKSEGQVKAKNDALKVITGEYVMFHDCDDVMQLGALARLVAALEEDASIMAVEAKVEDFVSPELPPETGRRIKGKDAPYWGLFTGAVLMRTAIWKIIGEFNPALHTGEIIEWQGKMDAHALAIRKLDFVACRRRIHQSNFGRTSQKTEYGDYASVLRAKLLAARRAGGIREVGETGTAKR